VDRSITASAPAASGDAHLFQLQLEIVVVPGRADIGVHLRAKPPADGQRLDSRVVHVPADHDRSFDHALPDDLRLNAFLGRSDFHFFRKKAPAGFFELCHVFLQIRYRDKTFTVSATFSQSQRTLNGPCNHFLRLRHGAATLFP
jgi:hypothetical protein